MPHSWNAYIETPERRFFQRCANCGTRRVVGLYHEVYDLGVACEGQCKDTCCHGWAYACQQCTLVIAGQCTERVRFARYQVRLDTIEEVLDLFDCEESDSAAHFHTKIENLRDSIIADQQHNGY